MHAQATYTTTGHLVGMKGSQLPSYVRCHARHRLYNPSCDVTLFNPFITERRFSFSLSLSLSLSVATREMADDKNIEENRRETRAHATYVESVIGTISGQVLR